jgi:type II secretory pathway component GspD/PulD (secretin)
MANDANTTDEFILAPVLPQPCPGENPMSAVIEITMIEAFESATNSSGINILDGLNAILTLGGSNARTSASGSSADTDTKTRGSSWLLANGASTTSVTYSLNIVNSGINQARLLSRPAMTVIDRVPSVFFAGSNISLGIAGDSFTAPTVVDKTIGVSLSVTPTFVDEDTVLISLRTSNAGISGALLNVPDALLQQTRNSMRSSAIMKFDQTIVINGLRQKSTGVIESGVPILKDLPLLQYLFKNNTETSTSLNYITFLTLRRPTPPKEADNNSVKNVIPALKDYISFTEKDFEVVTEQPKDKLTDLINDLKRLVYF